MYVFIFIPLHIDNEDIMSFPPLIKNQQIYMQIFLHLSQIEWADNIFIFVAENIDIYMPSFCFSNTAIFLIATGNSKLAKFSILLPIHITLLVISTPYDGGRSLRFIDHYHLKQNSSLFLILISPPIDFWCG